jgi:hypothetical protein
MTCEAMVLQRKGNVHGEPATAGPACQDYEEQIPSTLIQQTMRDPIVFPVLTYGFAKSSCEKLKIETQYLV